MTRLIDGMEFENGRFDQRSKQDPRLSSIGKERELIEGNEVCREDDSGPMGLKTSRSNHY